MDLNNIEVGQTIEFGSWPVEENGEKQHIEWRVLEKTEKSVLLITKHAIECHIYHEECTDITWEKCDLRKWLNNDFFNEAFSQDEKELIQTMNIKTPDNTEYKTKGGVDTEDQVFLLSIPEAEQYFHDDKDRAVTPTDLAKAHNVWTDKDNTCYWWLRSSGILQYNAASVYNTGIMSYIGCYSGDKRIGVRPAIRIHR